jgi:hypothetical protein
MLYHRHQVPFDDKNTFRQLCLDPIVFRADGMMEKIIPSHSGPAWLKERVRSRGRLTDGVVATASSSASDVFGPARVLDDNYATRWSAAKDAKGGWLQLDLGKSQSIGSQEIHFEYPWKPYRFVLLSSSDSKDWQAMADFRDKPAMGSPILMNKPVSARFLRMVFPDDAIGSQMCVVEWAVLR